jgi:transposase
MATTSSYPSDVSDEEWAVALPYVTLLSPTALQRKHDLRAVFNAVRYLAHTGVPWRYLPSDFPPWAVVYQQLRRWVAAGSFEALVHDTRLLLRTLKRAFVPAQRGHPGCACAAIDSGEWQPCGLQWAQAAQRLEGPCRRRYAGVSLGIERDPSERRRADPSPGADGAGPGGHWRTR